MRARSEIAAARRGPRPQAMLLVVVLGAIVGVSPQSVLLAQARAESAELVVSVAAIRSGDPTSDIEVADLTVAIAGEPVPSIELLPLSWGSVPRVVLYVDHSSARAGTIQRVARGLVAESAEITDLGPIEVVEADPVPRPAPRVSRKEDLDRILNRLFLRREPVDEVRALRRAYLSEIREGTEPPLELAANAYSAEVELRHQQIDRLLDWVASEGPARGPRALVLVNDNLALQARDFYFDGLEVPSGATLRWAPEPSPTELGRALAAFGWTLGILDESAVGDSGRLRYAPTEELPVGFRLRLGGRRDPVEVDEGSDLGWDRRAAAATAAAAEPTGGEVIAAVAEIRPWLEGLRSRRGLRIGGVQLEWGELVTLEVSPTRQLDVSAPTVLGRGAPEAIAAMRARKALSGEATDADVQVRSAIEFDPERLGDTGSRLEARVDLFELREQLGALDEVTFRVTIGVHLDNNELLLRHEVVPDVSVSGLDEWLYETSLRLPTETDGAVVVVELLEDAVWGESFASFMRTRTEPAAAEVESAGGAEREALLPGRRLLTLTPPTTAVVIGKVAIGAEADPSVHRVVYTLDGKRVMARRRAPWGATIDVGSNPRQRMLVAIAYDKEGREIGRDGLLLNEVARTFSVQIKEPRPGRRIGPVDVQAEVSTPDGSSVERLEFFWQDQLVSTVRRAPWRQRLFIPVAAQPGFIRVAAYLGDGRIAEDVVLMNADQFEERVTVNLVELYVVVTDRNGKPVRNLREGDFEVTEEGVVQDIERFDRAGDLPITVGLALDSSLSLFLKMPDVQSAASSFVDALIRERDRAFLVGFSSAPRVVRATTTNLENIVSGIHSLPPAGTTALWEAVTLSLLQLQEATGRKALVIFYDGDDEDEDFSFGPALKLSRDVGVPIYLVVMNNSAARSGGRTFGTKNRAERLERVARAGGGKVYYVRTDEDLGEIFAASTDELRSHYLLTS
ncbi:MAG: VWA domain-containing protein [Acidobacteriota bacterium]|nr:VWA domain-containing protein [Acidobacteriota bacterium]